MRKFIWPVIFIPLFAQASLTNQNTQRIIFTATVVASACHVQVNADGVGNNRLTFGLYRKSVAALVPPRHFTIRLSETGSTLLGCSAFLAGQIATLQFGNPGQLDSGGVVTRGAGDGVRIDVRATDPQANFRDRLTDGHYSVSYPTDFASKGLLHFRAQPVMPEDVRGGEYSGALAFVVTYQ